MKTKIDKDNINEHLRDSGRQIITDQAVKHDLTAFDFRNHQLQRLGLTQKLIHIFHRTKGVVPVWPLSVIL